MKRVAIFLADGFEEIEGLTVVDLLRRAKIEIIMVSVMGRKEVFSSHEIGILADTLFEEMDFSDFDMLVLPGGGRGVEILEAYQPLIDLLKEYYSKGKKMAAICAAPSIFGHLGFLAGKKACSYPSFEQELDGATVTKNEVEKDGRIITSRGMGCSIPFALEIIKTLLDEKTAEDIKKKVIYEQR